MVTPDSEGRYLANSYAAIQYFDSNSGTMVIEFLQSGAANAFTTGATTDIILDRTGKLTVGNTLHIANNRLTTTKTGAGNMIPIGIASVTEPGSKQSGTANITTSYSADHYVIELNEVLPEPFALLLVMQVAPSVPA